MVSENPLFVCARSVRGDGESSSSKYINVPRKQHEVQGKIESFKSRAGFP